MLDLRHVAEHLDEVKRELARRGFRDDALFARLGLRAE